MESKIIKALEGLYQLKDFKKNQQHLRYNPMEFFLKYVSTKEIVHSKIIGSLLNPNEQHGMNSIFLDLFLRELGLNYELMNKCHTFIEYSLKGGPWDKRRIDILVLVTLDGIDNAIIIENKLNGADYQPNQLQDYRAAIEEQYPPENVKVVCLPLHYTEKPVDADYVLYPKDIAEIIDNALTLSKSPETAYISAYSQYLKHLNIYNQPMDNARILANKVSDDYFRIYKSIVESFNKLPEAYAENLMYRLYEVKDSLNIESPEKEESYDNYVAIWTKKMYSSNKGFWISIGFDNDSFCIYAVSYEEIYGYEDMGLYYSSRNKNRFWYRFVDENSFDTKFELRPDYSKIINYIKNLISRL